MGIWDVFKGKGSTPDPVPASAESPSQPPAQPAQADLELVRARIEESLLGFDTYQDALERVTDLVRAEEVGMDQASVTAMLDAAWDQRVAEQDTWPSPGDATTIEAVFERLEENDIVAQPHFACCNTCGHDEIRDYFSETTRGYTFWHTQDSERLGDGKLLLSFGSCDYAPSLDPDLVARARGGDKAARATALSQSDALIGQEVTDALRAAGLTVHWDGNPVARIHLTGLEWRGRLEPR